MIVNTLIEGIVKIDGKIIFLPAKYGKNVIF